MQVAFSVCTALCFFLGWCFAGIGKASFQGQELTNREGILTVVMAWVITALFSALPFVLTGTLDFAGAFFEAVSGLTTTGATAFAEIESLPFSLLFWRSWMHWLGGLGIIVIFIALLPGIAGGAAHLINVEGTGFEDERILPRLAKTARVLFYIYGFLTVVTTVLLLMSGLTFFDALTHAMSAVATGGFSSYNDSAAHFRSAPVEIILGIAMVIAGGNFALYYKLLHRGPGILWRDDEFRWYIAFFAILVGIVTLDLAAETQMDLGRSLRAAFFQVASFISTTGFVSEDYDRWPALAKTCLLLLYFTGACAGSTAGGIKMSRFIVLYRGLKTGILRVLHPHEVRVVSYNGKKLESGVFSLVVNFFYLYIGTVIVFSAAVVATGTGIGTAITGVAACISSAGPGFGPVVGAVGNYSELPAAAKILLAFVMLLGRLEMYAVLVLFHRGFWRGSSRW